MIENKFYVYAYLRKDNESPYYIGKGCGDRAYSKEHRVHVPENSRIIFLEENLYEKDAFAKEKEYIAFYGRRDLGTGTLHNMTDGGEGVSGRVITQEERDRCSIREQKRFAQGKHPWQRDDVIKKRKDIELELIKSGKHVFQSLVKTPSHKKNIGISNKGNKRPDLSERNKTKTDRPGFGKTHDIIGHKLYHNPVNLEQKFFVEGAQPPEWVKGARPGTNSGEANPRFKGVST